MRKRLTVTIISITIIALMLCGWTAYAATSPNTSSSTSVTGAFKSVSSDAVTVITDKGDQTVPLAKSVWVYRDDQKAQLIDLQSGDRIELIVNSKQQAAYVKATSAGTPVPETLQAAAATPVPTPAPTSLVTSEEAAGAVPNAPAASASTQPSSQLGKEVYPDLEDIDLKVDGKHFKLHIRQTTGVNGFVYDLSIKPEDAGMIHLKGEQAAVWIMKLLGSVDLKSSNAEQLLAQRLAEHYNLDVSKLNVEMKTKWEQKQKSTLQKQEDSKENEYEDDDNNNTKNSNNNDDNENDHNKNNKNNNNKAAKYEDNKKNQKQHGNNHDD